jgi:predicted dehydrogenase
MSNIVKTAVIGVGHLGREHARVLASLEQSDLVAVCDTSEQAGRAVAEKFGVRYVRNYRELLGQVEAVTIATPTVNHHETACEFSRLVFTPWLKNRSPGV